MSSEDYLVVKMEIPLDLHLPRDLYFTRLDKIKS